MENRKYRTRKAKRAHLLRNKGSRNLLRSDNHTSNENNALIKEYTSYGNNFMYPQHSDNYVLNTNGSSRYLRAFRTPFDKHQVAKNIKLLLRTSRRTRRALRKLS